MTVKKVCCIGTGVIGGTFSSVAALKCPKIEFQVIEENEERVREWNSNEIPVHEPGLAEIVEACRGKNLFFTSDTKHLKTAEVIFVCTDPKTRFLKAGEMKALEDATRLIINTVESSKIIVEKSTVAIQAAEMMSNILRGYEERDKSFTLISNPEFITEGCAVSEVLNPERVLIGGGATARSANAAEVLVSIYEHWVPKCKIITSDMWSVELSNLAKAAFTAQVLNSINTISEVCEILNEDIAEVTDAIAMDPRIGIAGLKNYTGFRGITFLKSIDSILYLCKSLRLPKEAAYWQKLLDVSEHQKHRLTRKILETFSFILTGKTMLVLGFSLRKDTTCTRDSVAIHTSKFLLEKNVKLKIHDPAVPEEVILKDIAEVLRDSSLADKVPEVVDVCDDPYEAAKGAEALIFCSDWPSYSELDFFRMHNDMVKPAYVFDGNNVLPHKKLVKIGFQVQSLGKCMLKAPDEPSKDSA